MVRHRDVGVSYVDATGKGEIMRTRTLVISLVVLGLMVATISTIVASHVASGEWIGRTNQGETVRLIVDSDSHELLPGSSVGFVVTCPVTGRVDFATISIPPIAIDENGRFQWEDWTRSSYRSVAGRFISPTVAVGTATLFDAKVNLDDGRPLLCWSGRVRWIARAPSE